LCVDDDTVSAEDKVDGPLSDTLGDMPSDPGENHSLDVYCTSKYALQSSVFIRHLNTVYSKHIM